MNPILLLGIALALALDALAVTLGLSLSDGSLNRRQAFRLSFHFGLFQFLMPLFGWTAGYGLKRFIEAYDHWVAFGLLTLVGVKMIVESLAAEGSKKNRSDPTRGLSLFVLSVATSIDAFAVGLSFAALRYPILFPAFVIGIVAFGMSLVGSRLGPLIGRLAGRRAELVGGAILIGIGIKILVDHL